MSASASAVQRDSTKQRLLMAAREQFAQRGFYGASLANIASELGMTKQTLLHHFQSKEKLYATVLNEIATVYEHRIDEYRDRYADPLECFEAVMLDRLDGQLQDKADAQIVMRELLDNQDRVQKVEHWYLRPWLEALTDLALSIPSANKMSKSDAFAAVYQLLGAISYLGMSEPTFSNMFGKKEYKQLLKSYPGQLKALIRSRFQ